MMQSGDHERRRRAASSSDEDEDELYDNAAVDAAADAADAALASLAQHVFRRGEPRAQARESDSESSSSHAETIVDDETEPEGVHQVAVSEDDRPEESAVVEPATEAAESSLAPAADSNADGESAESRTTSRREIEEPPIPGGRKFRFYMHDDRDDDDWSNTRPPPTFKSRADGDWKHDLFERDVATRLSPRFQRNGRRPQRRWVPKGSREQLPLSRSAAASIPEWPGSQPQTEWRPSGYGGHVPAVKSTRDGKRWVPKQAAPATEPEPSPDSNWGAPKSVQAVPSTPPVQVTPSSPKAVEGVALTTTTMNPEAQEFRLPAVAQPEVCPTAPIVYASDVDPVAIGYWMYDGVMVSGPTIFEYGYPPDGLYYIDPPYDMVPASAVSPEPLADDARSANTTTS